MYRADIFMSIDKDGKWQKVEDALRTFNVKDTIHCTCRDGVGQPHNCDALCVLNIGSKMCYAELIDDNTVEIIGCAGTGLIKME